MSRTSKELCAQLAGFRGDHRASKMRARKRPASSESIAPRSTRYSIRSSCSIAPLALSELPTAVGDSASGGFSSDDATRFTCSAIARALFTAPGAIRILNCHPTEPI